MATTIACSRCMACAWSIPEIRAAARQGIFSSSTAHALRTCGIRCVTPSSSSRFRILSCSSSLGCLMAWLLHRGLAPMRQLAAEAENISIHRWSFRAPESAMETRELAPLASALKAAMQRLESSFSQQRRFVSDAAHELKTASRRRQIVAAVAQHAAAHDGRVRGRRRGEPGGLRADGGDCRPHADPGAGGTSHHGGTCRRHGGSRYRRRGQCTAIPVHGGGPVRQLALATSGPAFVRLPAEECSLLCSNLLLNALQHSPARTESKCCWIRKAKWVALRVEDHGDGIDPALLPHVFERFSRGDPSRSRNTGVPAWDSPSARPSWKRRATITLHSQPGRHHRSGAPAACRATGSHCSGRTLSGGNTFSLN